MCARCGLRAEGEDSEPSTDPEARKRRFAARSSRIRQWIRQRKASRRRSPRASAAWLVVRSARLSSVSDCDRSPRLGWRKADGGSPCDRARSGTPRHDSTGGRGSVSAEIERFLPHGPVCEGCTREAADAGLSNSGRFRSASESKPSPRGSDSSPRSRNSLGSAHVSRSHVGQRAELLDSD